MDQGDIKIYKAANMTQEDNGGGRMSSNVVVSGEVNNLFNNISEIDRVSGNLDLVKIYIKINTADTEVYEDANTAVLEPASDNNVNVFLMDAEDPNEERVGMINRLETYFLVSNRAGNSFLDSTASAGSRQLFFKTLHQEYAPVYDTSGALIYSSTVDSEYILGLSIGDLFVIGTDGLGNKEFAQVQDINIQKEGVDAEAILIAQQGGRPYLRKEYAVVTISDDLLYEHAELSQIFRVVVNPSWKLYGLCELKTAIAVDDGIAEVHKTTQKLIPTIVRNSLKENVPFYRPASYEDDVVLTRNQAILNIGSVSKYEITDHIDVTGLFYTHSFENPLSANSIVEIKYMARGIWNSMYSDATTGVLTGAGNGSVSFSQSRVTFSLEQQPDSGTVIILKYRRKHNYEELYNLDLITNIVSDQVVSGSTTVTTPESQIEVVTESPTNLGHVVDITSSTSSVPINVSTTILLEDIKVYRFFGGSYILILQTTADDQTTFTVIEPGYSGTINKAAGLMTINGPFLENDRIHSFYSSANVWSQAISTPKVLPAATNTADGYVSSVSLGLTNLVPGEVSLTFNGTLIDMNNGEVVLVRLCLRDNGYGTLNSYDPVIANFTPTGEDVGIGFTVNYGTGLVTILLGDHTLSTKDISYPLQIIPVIYNSFSFRYSPSIIVTVTTPVLKFYNDITELGFLVPPGNVVISDFVLEDYGTIKPGTFKVYESNNANGPWDVEIYSDNGLGAFSGSGSGIGSVIYATREVSISFNSPGYDMFWKFVYDINEIIPEYTGSFVVSLDFGYTDLIKNGVSVTYSTAEGTFNAVGDEDGFLVVDINEIIGTFEDLGGSGLSNSLDVMASGGNILIGGAFGLIGHNAVSASGGAEWNEPASAQYNGGFITAISGTLNGQLYYVFMSLGVGVGAILTSTNGVTWVGRQPDVVVKHIAINNNMAVVITANIYLVASLEAWTDWPSLVAMPSVDGYTANSAVALSSWENGTDTGFLYIDVDGGVHSLTGASTAAVTHSVIGLMPWAGDYSVLLYSEVNDQWLAAQPDKKLAVSDDRGATWDIVDISNIGGNKICGIAQNNSGSYMLITDEGRYTSADGRTWARHSSIFTDLALTGTHSSIVYHQNKWIHSYSNSADTENFLVKLEEGEKLTSPRVGLINYEEGTGVINQGFLPIEARSDLFLIEKEYYNFTVHTNGAAPIQAFEVNALDNTGVLMTEADLADYVINMDAGIAYGTWNRPFLPPTLKMTFSYHTIFHPKFEGLSTLAFPLSGEVPVVQKNDLILLSDRRKYTLQTGITASDTEIYLVDVLGFPPEFPNPCKIRIGDEEMLVQSIADNKLTIASGGRGYNSTSAVIHEGGVSVFLLTINKELLPVDYVMYDSVGFGNVCAHNYSAGAIISNVLLKGNLYAKLSGFHNQESWDLVTWVSADEYTGNPAGGTYDFTTYPMGVTNEGAETDRFILRVVNASPLTVDVYKEASGVIATDVLATAPIAPNNPNTNAPYFTLAPGGWGSNWNIGNILSLDFEGADPPVVVIRSVDAKASDSTNDSAVIGVKGYVST